MKSYQPDHLVIAHNDYSSHAARVQGEVFDRLDGAGVKYERFYTPSANPQENIAAVAAHAEPGQVWLSAAGDGTANAVLNGLLEADQADVKAGFLGYGNFNDMANVFSGWSARRHPLRLLASETTTTLRPLDVIKNGEHWRYGGLYATLGWTALAAHEFDDPAVRARLQKGGANIVSSLAHLGKYYFKTRRSSELPVFTREGRREQGLTDVLAVNGPIMAKIIRSGQNKYNDMDFLRRDLDVSGLIKNAGFLALSGLGRMPGQPTEADELHFAHPATLPVQLDGEFMQLRDVSSLKVQKTPTTPTLEVLTGRPRRR